MSKETERAQAIMSSIVEAMKPLLKELSDGAHAMTEAETNEQTEGEEMSSDELGRIAIHNRVDEIGWLNLLMADLCTSDIKALVQIAIGMADVSRHRADEEEASPPMQ